MTTWERNLENVKRAQLRAKTQIASLEQQGLVVEKTLKDLAYRPLKQRYTAKQARDYINLLQKKRIESRARLPYKMPPFIGDQNITSVKRYSEVIYVRPQHIAEDIANSVYKALSYSLSKNTIGKSNEMATAIKKLLQTEMKLKSKAISKSYKKIDKYFRGIKKSDFIDTFIKLYSSNNTSLMGAVKTYYSYGLTSIRAKEERDRIISESTKKVFKDRHKLSEDQSDALYEYFKKSTVWSKFRSKNHPSNDEKIDDWLRDMGDYLSEDLGVDVLDDLITKHDDIGKALDEYLSSLDEKN